MIDPRYACDAGLALRPGAMRLFGQPADGDTFAQVLAEAARQSQQMSGETGLWPKPAAHSADIMYMCGGTPSSAAKPDCPTGTPNAVGASRRALKTFGFAELGMFGRNGATGPVASPEESRVGDPAAAAAEPGIANDAAEHANERAEFHRTAHSLDRLDRMPAAKTHWLRLCANSIARGGATGVASGQAGVAFDTAEEAPVASRRPVRRYAARNATPQASEITVSGDGDAINIVVRIPDAPLDGRVLKDLIDATAAEFGVHVAEFHLNGTDRTFAKLTGGQNGHRAR